MTDKQSNEQWKQEANELIQSSFLGIMKMAGPLLKKYRESIIDGYEDSDMAKQGVSKDDYIKMVDEMIANSEKANNPH